MYPPFEIDRFEFVGLLKTEGCLIGNGNVPQQGRGRDIKSRAMSIGTRFPCLS